MKFSRKFDVDAIKAPVIIWMSGPDEAFSFVNDAWLEFTGIPGSWYERMHPEDIPRWVRAYQPAVDRQEGFTVEIRLQRKDGTFRWMSCQGHPRLDQHGSFQGFTGACIDIHDLRLNEEALERRVSQRTLDLQQANTFLQQRNAELEQFAYVTSHDLQEPLRKIRVFVDMLLHQELEKDRYHALDRIRSSADRMAQLIRDLLSYSRVGREGSPFESTDLNTIALAALRDFDLRIEETGARVHLLPLPTVDAVPLQMNQLFCNLLGNALKFQRPGVAPHLRISSQLLTPGEVSGYPSLEQGGLYHRIVVKDNGIGFSQTFADKIFVIFQRLHPREHYPGTGIGLAICRKIAHQHHGEIIAYGKEGEGAEFHVILPQHYRAPATP
jgi:two-component system CheB/CheR fusion protein